MVDNNMPAYNLEAEKALLGCIIFDNETSQAKTVLAEIANKIQPIHFYHDKHREIYKIMLELYTKQKPIDLILLNEEINRKKLDISSSYLTDIANISEFNGWEYYADIIIDKYSRRKIRAAALKIMNLLEKSDLTVTEIIGQTQQIICESTDVIPEENSFDMQEIYESLSESVMNRKNSPYKHGIATRFIGLDRFINGGIRFGDYGIIGARPSMGKTALTINLLLNIAARRIPVHFFSLEMSKEKIYERMISCLSRIPHRKIITGNLNEEEERFRDKAMSWLLSLPIVITEKVNDIAQI